MAFYYNKQDDSINWYQSELDEFYDLNQFNQGHMYVSEEEIYFTHASPEESLFNDWSIYKNTGLEDMVYPDYTGLVGEDSNNGVINYNQLLRDYEVAMFSGVNPLYDFVDVVQNVCDIVYQVDEAAVLKDPVTQPDSPQHSFSSVIDYSICASDEGLDIKQETKQALNNKWQPSEQEWDALKEIHRANCSAFIGDDTTLNNVVLYSDQVPAMFVGSQKGKGASSKPIHGNSKGLEASNAVFNKNTFENALDDSHVQSPEERTASRSVSRAKWPYCRIQ